MTYKTQRIFSDGIPGQISHMKTSTRLLYVFYRDGALLFMPWIENDLTDGLFIQSLG